MSKAKRVKKAKPMTGQEAMTGALKRAQLTLIEQQAITDLWTVHQNHRAGGNLIMSDGSLQIANSAVDKIMAAATWEECAVLGWKLPGVKNGG